MEIDETELAECMWEWDTGEQLVRDLPNLESLEPGESAVDIYGIPYVQGGGRASYQLLWPIGHTPAVLIETRDFSGEAHLEDQRYPLWANARVVPQTFSYRPCLIAILEDLG